MTEMTALWLPTLVSAVAVFVASSIIHMLLPWHKSDYRKVPDEDGVMKALRPFGIPAGDYMMPRPASMDDMKSAEFQAKREAGPAMMFTIFPKGPISMGPQLAQWFVYLIIVSALAACAAASTVAPGGHEHAVFHHVAYTAFLAYAVALWQISIWYKRSWLTTLKSTIDSVVYALLTGWIFSMMWPAA